MNLIQIVVLAIIQGLGELLPVSSSAHVIAAEKLMGLDPSAPEMTFLLVMLHTGTMFAAIVYFWKRWRALLSPRFIQLIVVATFFTGIVGLGLKFVIETILEYVLYGSPALAAAAGAKGEIEHLFKNLPMISGALFCVGLLIIYAGTHEGRAKARTITFRNAGWVGVIQGICLPFRGFSRSGATISTGILKGIDRNLAEEFSFALAVVLTPPVILQQLYRLKKATGSLHPAALTPGLIGMFFAFLAGLVALRWLSSWLEHGKWKYFGYYCLVASAGIAGMAFLGY